MSHRLWTFAAVGIVAPCLTAAVLFTGTGANAANSPPYRQPTPVKQWTTGKYGGTSWMFKANDWAEFPQSYIPLRWLMCGWSVGYGAESPGSGAEPDAPCEGAQNHTYTSYTTLISALPRLKAGVTIVYDPETWSWTPKWQQGAEAPILIRKACQAAAKYSIKVIVTPGEPKQAYPNEYVAGARYCYIVEDQSQSYERDYRTYVTQVKEFLAIVHEYHGTPMIGLATDPSGAAATAAQLEKAFSYAHGKGVVNYWMNAAAWSPPTGDGTGDASVGMQFFTWLAKQGG